MVQTAQPTAPKSDLSLEERPARRRLTIDECLRMQEAGILSGDERLELYDGELLMMSPIGGPHRWVVRTLSYLLFEKLPRSVAEVEIQGGIDLSPVSQLSPDIAVVSSKLRNTSRGPAAADVLLLIEVSDTTLKTDRGWKKQVYAQAGICEYWIINLPEKRLEINRSPDPEAQTYRVSFSLAEDGRIAPLAFPDVVIDAAVLFPPED
ncbi:MAG: Uma2 family endonuclease [Sumerlaeia bacterium]